MQTQNKQRIYGPLGRAVRQTARLCSHRYACGVQPQAEPCVYVCRHLNMHGPWMTLKWLPFEVHPFVLHVFLEEESAIRQYTEYTFSQRLGKPAKAFCLPGWVLGSLTPKLMRSLGAIPVHRDAAAIKMLRSAMKCLEKGESLIIWPDVHYTQGYDQPCEIYRGFLYLGELYQRKTGRELRFVPLFVDDEKREIVEREAVVVNSFHTEGEAAARALEKALNPMK